jgi:hypothetical protein
MRRILVCVVIAAACEKAGTGATGSSPGSANPPRASVIVKPADGAVASLGGVDASTPVLADAGTPIAVDAGSPVAVVDAAPARGRRDAAQDKLMREMEANAARIADLLTADSSPLDRDMSRRRPGADLDAQLRNGSLGGGSVRIGGGGSRVGSIGSIGDASVQVGGGAGRRGRATIAAAIAHDQSTLDASIVTSKILRAYMAGIKRCYHHELSRDPAARGRIRTTFTVNETGRTAAAHATGFSKELDLCLEGLMPAWRFPIPKDTDGEPTDASFTITLELVPS